MTGRSPDPGGYDPTDPLFRPLTIAEAAANVGRSVRTIKQWIREGRLTAFEAQNPRQIVLVEKDVVEVERANQDAFAAGRPRKVRPAEEGSP